MKTMMPVSSPADAAPAVLPQVMTAEMKSSAV